MPQLFHANSLFSILDYSDNKYDRKTNNTILGA